MWGHSKRWSCLLKVRSTCSSVAHRARVSVAAGEGILETRGASTSSPLSMPDRAVARREPVPPPTPRSRTTRRSYGRFSWLYRLRFFTGARQQNPECPKSNDCDISAPHHTRRAQGQQSLFRLEMRLHPNRRRVATAIDCVCWNRYRLAGIRRKR